MTIHVGPIHDTAPRDFIVSAPGKIILFGEHAVVYGKLAIAAPIGMRTFLYVETSTSTTPCRKLTLHFHDIGLEHSWNLSCLPWSIAYGARYRVSKKTLTSTIIPELKHALEPLILTVSPHHDETTQRVHRTAASTFLYMFMLLANPFSASCTYHLRSTIPVGAGLGSSASIAVCFSTALLVQYSHLSLPGECSDDVDVMYSLGSINEWALLGEISMHGQPSGIDNMVATVGKVISFRKGGGGEHAGLQVEALDRFPELLVLIANSMQSRSTALEVRKVLDGKTREPQATETILNAIDHIAELALMKIASHKDGKTAEGGEKRALVRQLGHLMHMNHGLLVALGVSHPKLEHIRDLVDSTGHGFTKLTGAGGGGCTISLLEHERGSREVVAIEERLRGNGYQAHVTTLSKYGVGFCALEECAGGKGFDKAAFIRGGEAVEVERAAVYRPSAHDSVWKFWD
ncbi:Hypothetical protein R9X50_00770000 [Acrodontium crateriforme]|uniref:Mevalonate kinase n=1 Tax=Acrodontium crateriforme TaxID=150365 RepID=A0AAQ3MAK3_9PEZI|nr:Hypothetical protein R9X50_00770000 [Acrodontium crateriforme]